MWEVLDRTALLGASGTIASYSLAQWNEVLGICVGAVTLTYMSIKLAKLLCEKDDK